MASPMDSDDLANLWWTQFEQIETASNPRKRGRSRSRTPSVRKRSDRAPSRARGMQPRRLTFSSVRTRSRSRSTSLPRKKVTWGKAAFYAANKGKSSAVIEKAWRKTAQGKRNQSTLRRLFKLSNVRHNLTRKNARKIMPRGKPYARRKTMTKPKGAYRGALMPRWAKGETKHILTNDNCPTNKAHIAVGNTAESSTGLANRGGETTMDIGEILTWSLNPCAQGTSSNTRNGRSIDGTYCRVQGHIRNTSPSEKAYVRFLILAVKGGTDQSVTRAGAPFVTDQLFKRIDGEVAGFAAVSTNQAASGSTLVRSLQLGVNKNLYTVLVDQKFQLASTAESFGSSDRLFDFKTKLKQRTSFGNDKAYSFEKNQLVFVCMTVDPECRSTTVGDLDPEVRDGRISLEFEGKYSYKDF